MTLVVFFAIALTVAIVSRSRARWTVAAGSTLTAVLTLAWGAFAWIAATPCALSGRGLLTATPQCPVQATHIVSAIIGLTGFAALLVGSIAGITYATDRGERSQRVFQVALLLGAALIVLWLASDLILPRAHPSD
jgi:hypothetical protein